MTTIVMVAPSSGMVVQARDGTLYTSSASKLVTVAAQHVPELTVAGFVASTSATDAAADKAVDDVAYLPIAGTAADSAKLGGTPAASFDTAATAGGKYLANTITALDALLATLPTTNPGAGKFYLNSGVLTAGA